MSATKEKCKEWMEVTDKNIEDIQNIKQDINTIKTNHLFHIERDMEKQSKQIEKIDNRIWWVLGLLVASLVMSMVKSGIGV
jgi:hypothetical protein